MDRLLAALPAWVLLVCLVACADGPARAGPPPVSKGEAPAGPAPSARRPVPVILDTDIGGDIDDTWALVTLLKSPGLRPLLIVGDHGKARYRAKLIAKILEVAGRTDIPVGIGCDPQEGEGRQAEWVKDYRLEDYPGTVHRDGVGAIIQTVLGSAEPVTVIAIGPADNLGKALRREPRIATKARFVGMHGSIYKGYGGKDRPDAEYNVRAAPHALQVVFAAPWPVTITPLDTCGLVRLRGEKFAKVRDAADPLLRALMENYRIWARKKTLGELTASSTLYDTVAIYLAETDARLCKMETLPLRVTDRGMTVIDREGGRPVRAAVAWKDLGAYEDWLVGRLLGPTVRPPAR